MQREFGLNLKEDLFSWMDNEVGVIYSDFPQFAKDNISDQICLLIKVTDSEKSSQGMEKLTTLGINIAKDKEIELNIQPQEYMSETIYAVSESPIPIKPGYAIVNNFLLISPSTEYIKKLIDCSAGRVKNISESTVFQHVKDRIPEKMNAIGLIDMERYIEQVISDGIQKRVGKFPRWEDEDLNLDKVMMIQLTELGKALAKACGPSVNVILNDGMGLKSNAFNTFKDLETVVPISDPPIAKLLRSIQIADEYRDVGMVDRALQYYMAALELNPDNFAALMGAAEMLRRQGRILEAEEYWLRIGFLPESAWYVIGPFDNHSNTGFDTVYPSEEGVDFDAEYEGIDGILINWQQWADDTPNGFVDFQYMFEPDQWVVAYAWTTVISPETREVQLRVGSDDDVKVWLNGQEVLSRKMARAAEPDQDIAAVILNEGENQLLVKVCNREMNWGFYLRFTDADGKSLEDLEYGK
jgi:tetratricopeptide (TPR) repeat protein